MSNNQKSSRILCHLTSASLLLCAVSQAQTPSSAPTTNPARLTDGIQYIIAPGTPGTLAVFGPDAQPLVVGRTGKDLLAPVVAAATLDKGRIVAFGHTGYLSADTARDDDTARLLESCIRWTANRTKGSEPKRIGLLECDFGPRFSEWNGLEAVKLSGPDWPNKLADLDALVCMPSKWSTEQAAAVEKFVRAGGGLVVAQTGWGWLQLNPGQNLRTHAANRLLMTAGLAWSDGTADRTSDAGFEIKPIPELCHAGKAIDALDAKGDAPASLSDKDRAQASWTATSAVRWLPEDDRTLRPRLAALLTEHSDELAPSDKHRLGKKQGLARLLLALQLEDARNDPPEKVRAHPAARIFPGEAPVDSITQACEIEVDCRVPGWHSTGLYAPAGGVVTIRAAGELKDARLTLQIGAHTDRLWDNDNWARVPEITRRFPLLSQTLTAASPFGGLVYFDVPGDSRKDTIKLSVSGVIKAPLFELGRTDPAEWRDQIRNRPGPWAELASNKVIVTVPSENVRRLDDPAAVLEVWDRILDAAATLAARPLERERPERYVADVQISAGYMHSGYPIMTHLDAAAAMVSREKLLAGQWGLVHELGHNHQSGDWTFAGTGEVTNNVFSIYILEKVCGIETRKGHEALSKLDELTRKHLAAGAPFEKWESDPFLALTMYVQLREAFGWEPFIRVFGEYRTLAADARPKNDGQKRDQWLTRLSRAVGRNLGPFFTAWGIPTSDSARQSLADLPGWMPLEFPPKQ